MCYHTKFTKKVKQIEDRYNVGFYNEDAQARVAFDVPMNHINGFSHGNQLIITQEYSEHLITAKWGLAPSKTDPQVLSQYYKKAISWGAGLNARSEKAFTDWNYKQCIHERRCIIPLDGFYEPHTLPNKEKVPFHFKYGDNSCISMAGVYNVLEGGLVTFTIFTREANDQFKEIHNVEKKGTYRMPLILDEFAEEDWLDPDSSEGYLQDLLTSFTRKEIEAYPVSKMLFNPREDFNIEGIDQRHDFFKDPMKLKFNLNGYKSHLFGKGDSTLFD